MENRVTMRLYRSLRSGDPLCHDWFEAALESAMRREVGLDQVIWESVRDILNRVEQEADRPVCDRSEAGIPPDTELSSTASDGSVL